MQPITQETLPEVLGNATARELDEIEAPLEFLVLEWDRVTAFGWRDAKFAQRGYFVADFDGEPVGIVLKAAAPPGSRFRAAMCAFCHTQQPADQVRMFAARRAGDAGERGDTVGTYLCADLKCHENIGLPVPLAPSEVRPVGLAAERADRYVGRVRGFVADVLGRRPGSPS
ncbi:FBP domain-containing protein [Agromyces seonyuensis]|uniref:FBP domain-containing protein n=1 Tax=Agromyces seonyuensis TaxID=2662446 RepID=A0A6I4NW36_9MICO|nr:FBP domain-containing protein [Agromyces seonyuensis]MWB98473.1 FBP domain-containing protein [Agromyces seonyuensis]